MTPKIIPPKLEALKAFLADSQLDGKLVFATMEANESIKLSYAVLKRDTVNDYRENFVGKIEEYSEKDPVRYGLSDFEPDTYQYLSAMEIPQATTLLKDPQTPVTHLDSDFIKTIKFTEFRFQNKNGDIMAVFKIYPKTLFLASQNRFKFFLDNSVLTPFTKGLIVAPPRFDCILFNGTMYIFKRSNFEKIFDYKKVFEEKATEVFAYFKKPKGYKIEGLDQIRAKCMGDRSKMRRLAIISQSAYQSFSFDKAASFAKRKGLTDPTFDLKKRAMKFRSTRAFFRLFEEQYVRGELTNTDYIASRKTLLRTPKQ